jgi:endonuclease YncB( thermonuclease family)
MLGSRRASDGFKWVAYVPTQLRARRQARQVKVKQMRDDAGAAARRVARRSLHEAKEGIRHAGPRAARLMLRSGLILDPVGRAAASLLGRIGAILGRLEVPRIAGLVGVLLLIAAAFIAWSNGADAELRWTLVAATGAVLIAVAPTGWRMFAPPVARWALTKLEPRGGRAVKTVRIVGNSIERVRTLPYLAPAALGVVVLVGAVVTLPRLWPSAWTMPWIATRPVEGRAAVVAADVVRVAGTEIQLVGIAPPEPDQTCGEARKRWRCGREARSALRNLVEGRSLRCSVSGAGSGHRSIGRCQIGGKDVAGLLVGGGHVWADRWNTGGYGALEAKARDAKLGIWRTASTPPWNWRAQAWDEARKDAPNGCPIKAEVTRQGRFYHLPGSEAYDRVKVAKQTGKRVATRWFCSESEAIREGYTSPSTRG